MKFFTGILTVIIISAVTGYPSEATAAQTDSAIEQAMANPIRSDEDRERDARSQPEVILGLLDLKPGQHVVDILGGMGYYSDLMVGIVGPEGEIILHNNTPYSQFFGEKGKARYVDNPIPGIVYLKSDVDDLQLEANTLDAALMVMSYHDLYFVSEERGWTKTDIPLFLSQVRAALKPGGKLLIVDHSAVAGTGKSAPQEIHRIDETFVKQDIESNGFNLIATSDALRNPDDDRTKMVFDPGVRGKTDRFILLFEKE